MYDFIGKDDWLVIPWFTPAYLGRVQKQLGTVPSRFARLIENRVFSATEGRPLLGSMLRISVTTCSTLRIVSTFGKGTDNTQAIVLG